MPRYEELRLRTGEPILEEWFDTLIDVLENITERGAVSYGGYVHADLVPDKDLLLNLGTPTSRFKELHAGYGYFSYNVWIKGTKVEELPWYGGYIDNFIAPEKDLLYNLGFANKRWKEAYMGYGYASYAFYVAGKTVIKDGDPITVEDLGYSAKEKITQAIDSAKITDYTAPLHPDLETLINTFKPYLLSKLINQSISGNADAFASDVYTLYDGRARFKFTLSTDAYAYVKWIPKGTTEPIISSLNAGISIPANAWHEFDFTVSKDDRVNFRLDKSATITITLFNIPNT